MHFRKLLAAGAAATTLFAAGAANAAIVFVGSWQVNSGLSTAPLSGQQAAALIFGGDASDYMISTVSDQAADINFKALYGSTFFPGEVLLDDQAASEFAPGVGMSAYIADPSIEARFVNYAFKDDGVTGGVPEPATWALMIGGFGLAGGYLRRRRAALG
jgi:hypothetical protein